MASAELVASQPWPCGRGASCEIMLAVAARADPTAEAVDVGTDGVSGGGELEAAKWFDRAEVGRLLKAMPGGKESWVPGSFAIAQHLLAHWEKGTLRVPRLP